MLYTPLRVTHDVMIKFANVLLCIGGSAAACVNRPSNSAPAEAAPQDTVAAMSLSPSDMARVGTVDERYQSYNVEMLEVTGGKFWRPYGPTLDAILREKPKAAPGGKDTPAGMNPELYEYRPPID